MPETTDDSNTPAATQVAEYEGDTICPSIHKALRAELEQIKKMLEASSSDEEANAANKPLFEVVRECAPPESPLTSFLDNRSHTTTTRISLMSHGGYGRHSIRTPQDVWGAVDQKEPSKDHILTLRDIDSDWCEALCARYPGSIDRRFLLEHILGLDLHLFPGPIHQAPYVSRSPLKGRMDEAGILSEISADTMQLLAATIEIEIIKTQHMSIAEGRSTTLAVDPTLHAEDRILEDLVAFLREYANTANDFRHALIGTRENMIREHLLATVTRFDSCAKKARGVHVNWWRAPQSEDHTHYAFNIHEAFRRTKKGWAKSNAFVSCCRLADNLCE